MAEPRNRKQGETSRYGAQRLLHGVGHTASWDTWVPCLAVSLQVASRRPGNLSSRSSGCLEPPTLAVWRKRTQGRVPVECVIRGSQVLSLAV